MEKVTRATLRYLFQEYVKGPTVPYAINFITDLFKADAVKVSDYLLEQKWVRERWIHQNNIVTCRITITGIEEVNPSYIHNKLRQLIGGLIDAGGTVSLVEILANRIQEYSVALDLVYQLEKMRLITILHQGGNIIIELTPFGWQYIEKRGKSLFSLMSLA